MDFVAHMAQGFSVALSPSNLAYAFAGAVIGTSIGVLPGLGTPATIALLLPVTYTMDGTSAVIMLAGIFYGAMYGGSTTSILLKIPGEAASIVTCLDGYEMARQGRAGPALGMSAISSFLGASLSVLAMSTIAPALANFALRFGPPEYASLVFLGLMMAVYLSEGSILKGLLVAAFGIVVGTVGIDPVFGAARFTFSISHLVDGVNFVAAAMGLFGIAEILSNLAARDAKNVYKTSLGSILPSRDDWRRCWAPILRGSSVGFLIGVLPGGGAVISSFVAYAVEKRVSAQPGRFGRGAIEGVAAPESANNAAATSSFIPLLTLGIPGNASVAMIFVALMIHGIQPGPLLSQQHPQLFWGVVASMYVGNLMLLALNLPLVGVWARLLRVPYHYLAAMVLITCVIGAYSINNAIFDVVVMLVFGVFGYLLRKGGFPAAPLVLAMILGRILEQSFLQSLQLSAADLRIFVAKPISATLLALAAVLMLIPLGRWLWRQRGSADVV